jgi:hypothetical protein
VEGDGIGGDHAHGRPTIRLALGDLATFSIDRDEDLLIQRIGQQRMQLLLAAAAGVAALPLAETGVQQPAAGSHLVIVLVVRHMRLPLLRRSGYVDYRNKWAVQLPVFSHMTVV